MRDNTILNALLYCCYSDYHFFFRYFYKICNTLNGCNLTDDGNFYKQIWDIKSEFLNYMRYGST